MLPVILGQAIKSKRWMPWRKEATKDAVSSESLGELLASDDPGVSEWGNPALRN